MATHARRRRIGGQGPRILGSMLLGLAWLAPSPTQAQSPLDEPTTRLLIEAVTAGNPHVAALREALAAAIRPPAPADAGGA